MDAIAPATRDMPAKEIPTDPIAPADAKPTGPPLSLCAMMETFVTT